VVQGKNIKIVILTDRLKPKGKVICIICTLQIFKTEIILNLYVQTSIWFLIMILFFLKQKKWLNWKSFGYAIFLYMILFLPLGNIFIKNNIEQLSINRFGIPPVCIDLDLSICGTFRHPHALVKKDGKYYYWSFRENNFIENNNIQGC